VPRLAIERTIEDARAVLASGQRVLSEVLHQAQDPTALANPELDIPGNVRAAIRLYVDTPEDIRNRCRRLTTWLHAIAQAQQQAGIEPLSSQVSWPGEKGL
jgi:LytS/YehU family sensor histidine kinase